MSALLMLGWAINVVMAAMLPELIAREWRRRALQSRGWGPTMTDKYTDCGSVASAKRAAHERHEAAVASVMLKDGSWAPDSESEQ